MRRTTIRELGTYNYLGRDWPDVSKLNTGDYFEQFAVVGLVLNSLMLLGVFVFCSSLGANSILPLATLLYVTNPYFIAQTILHVAQSIGWIFYPARLDLDPPRPWPGQSWLLCWPWPIIVIPMQLSSPAAPGCFIWLSGDVKNPGCRPR